MEQSETVNGLTLKQWTDKVDALFWDRYDIGVYEVLGDFSSWDMWHSEMSPDEAFEDLEADAQAEIDIMLEVADKIFGRVS